MDWLLIGEIVYLLAIIATAVRVIYDSRTTGKTLAYLLLIIFLPILGVIFYFTFGINYRTRRMYNKKLIADQARETLIRRFIYDTSQEVLNVRRQDLDGQERVARLLLNESMSPLTAFNEVRILNNGEEKFPELERCLQAARETIHIEYYIFEEGRVGERIKELLLEKAAEGVKIRLIYDDFGSRGIRGSFLKELRKAGIEAFPFYKIQFLLFANRLNYRNHRKIIVIDGQIGFVGGINVSDRYINSPGNDQVYWRDTHLKITGFGCYTLQSTFMSDWNFCADQQLEPNLQFFPRIRIQPGMDKVVQIATSGPDSAVPSILYALMQVISSAKEEVLITTPYFIPDPSLMDLLVLTALSGVSVKLLVPKKSDSLIVDIATRSYFRELLQAGVQVYCYEKGFIHSKTLVCDRKLAVIGTANMDVRSFELNFEVNAHVYDAATSEELAEAFLFDLESSELIDAERWGKRSFINNFMERLARLLSPLL